jgi:hypothetical protein
MATNAKIDALNISIQGMVDPSLLRARSLILSPLPRGSELRISPQGERVRVYTDGPHTSIRGPDGKIFLGPRETIRDCIQNGFRRVEEPKMGYRGVGDSIALSGLCVYLSRFHGKVFFPVEPTNWVNAKSFFVNIPAVTIVPLQRAKLLYRTSPNLPGLSLIFDAIDLFTEPKELDLYQRVYAKFDIPYSARWDDSPIAEAAKRASQVRVPGGEFAFIAEDVPRLSLDENFLPQNVQRFYPNFNEHRSILSFADAVTHASSVHVPDSAFFHLAEQLEPRGELFLHHYPKRNFSIPTNAYRTKHAWNLIF